MFHSCCSGLGLGGAEAEEPPASVVPQCASTSASEPLMSWVNTGCANRRFVRAVPLLGLGMPPFWLGILLRPDPAGGFPPTAGHLAACHFAYTGDYAAAAVSPSGQWEGD